MSPYDFKIQFVFQYVKETRRNFSMRKEVLICDKCLKQKSSVQSFSWKTGASVAGLDGKQEDEVKSIDLCKACVTEIVAVKYPELKTVTTKEDDVGE